MNILLINVKDRILNASALRPGLFFIWRYSWLSQARRPLVLAILLTRFTQGPSTLLANQTYHCLTAVRKACVGVKLTGSRLIDNVWASQPSGRIDTC